jgi:hypothetical protein
VCPATASRRSRSRRKSALLESHRDDVQVYHAYERHAERLEARGARIERVILDYELKREYQKWLHERDKDRDDYDRHPDRTAEEIREWALEHDLPCFDDEVHFPDLRIEYELDDRLEHRNIEVTTEHQAAFASPRFQQVYRRWLTDGDTVFEALASPATTEALARGTDTIESRILLSYGSPIVTSHP